MTAHPPHPMLSLAHKVASNPWVYDLIQKTAGQQEVFKWVARELQVQAAAPSLQVVPEVVLEVGGGTGIWRTLWPASVRYVCLDLEMPKLLGFRAKYADGLAVLGDASRMAITDASVDVVTCFAVVHHLSEPAFAGMLQEARRVLRPGGRLILLDAVRNNSRPLSRVLWALDRGSNPRTEDELRTALSSSFSLVHWGKFAVYHQYVLAVAVRP